MEIVLSEKQILQLGKTLVCNLFVLLKTAKNYGEGHSAMVGPVERLFATVEHLISRKESVILTLEVDHLMMGEHRLKPDMTGLDAFNYVIKEMKQYSIAEIAIDNSVETTDLLHFAYFFEIMEADSSLDSFEKISAELKARNINNIRLKKLDEDSGPKEKKEDFEGIGSALKVYCQVSHATHEVMECIRMGQTIKFKKAKRAVQCMIDELFSDEIKLVGLTSMRCYDEYSLRHPVNVAILSLACGKKIGFGKAELCELGMAALFHDLGKLDLPLEILNKGSEKNEDEKKDFEKHPIMGIKYLMKYKGLDALNAKIIAGAFEHHLNYDLSGYPNMGYKRPISLFGRIISIADAYDSLTSSKVSYSKSRSPFEALRLIISKAGSIYDPLLLKLFIASVGALPLGSIILLNTKELAVVVGISDSPSHWNSPKIRIIYDSAGNRVHGEIVDLAAPGIDKTISTIINPERYKINASRCFA